MKKPESATIQDDAQIEKEIGKFLQQLRRDYFRTQENLAAKMSRDSTSISNYENGRNLSEGIIKDYINLGVFKQKEVRQLQRYYKYLLELQIKQYPKRRNRKKTQNEWSRIYPLLLILGGLIFMGVFYYIKKEPEKPEVHELGEVDLDLACKDQFPAELNPRLFLENPNDPNSWVCLITKEGMVLPAGISVLAACKKQYSQEALAAYSNSEVADSWYCYTEKIK